MSARAIETDVERAGAGVEEVLDVETGEILELPTGADRLLAVVRKLRTAQEQEKAWGQQAAFLKTLLVREQAERTVVYDDCQVSIVFATRQEQDIEGLRREMEALELTAAEWRELALAAKGFDIERLSGEVGELVREHSRMVATRPYPRLTTVRRLAKGVAS